MFSLICVWINDWVNNREAGDLRRQRGHNDVIVMGRKAAKFGGRGFLWTVWDQTFELGVFGKWYGNGMVWQWSKEKTRTRLDTVSTHVIELPYYRRYQLDIGGIILYKPDCFNVIWCTLRRCRWFYINFYMLDVMNDLLFCHWIVLGRVGGLLDRCNPLILAGLVERCDKHSRNPY